MKIQIEYIVVLIMLIVTGFMTSCDPNDYQIEWGLSKVYIPQAINSGSTFYSVPTGNNYSVDSVNNKININLGVYRSGLQKLESFTVNVGIDNDTINKLITDAALTNTVLMTSDIYTIPQKVTVPDGSRDVNFNLSLDKTKLTTFYNTAGNSGLSMALAVYISNPTKYELNPTISKVIVVVDVAKVLGLP